ncbi:MAG TPA: PEP-CTERM sorting domain-containing protein [Rhodopirellula baltica]|uniref:Ice-binding protein C-terminal domain-containing protein n=1 Tax=Rhodopirellula baltica (strain DSM 10527 / NCIMB 13988 / SH1) TaxID=243090 RepID=Q7UWM4_RHOBA|nr:PEP-CTERM sorting domain-containing protein [Rhodopirellula baltica]CAD72338.1 hypothetical protein-signal peptide and transmembrane prediction [Rhodopirellula baltica SH 1]HBE66071.1 PEP-CTERM sorting domain-containing protein [Rhodopirellula baltica]
MCKFAILKQVSLLILLSLSSNFCEAAVVATYSGTDFGTATFPFTSNDSISGSATFANLGDSTPTQINLEVTLNEGPGFQIVDTSGLTGLFVWTGTSITSWNVTLLDDVIGGVGLEQLDIDSVAGDVAAVDDGAAGFAVATTTGLWAVQATAVPEPSSITLLASGLVLLVVRRVRGLEVRWQH